MSKVEKDIFSEEVLNAPEPSNRRSMSSRQLDSEMLRQGFAQRRPNSQDRDYVDPRQQTTTTTNTIGTTLTDETFQRAYQQLRDSTLQPGTVYPTPTTDIGQNIMLGRGAYGLTGTNTAGQVVYHPLQHSAVIHNPTIEDRLKVLFNDMRQLLRRNSQNSGHTDLDGDATRSFGEMINRAENMMRVTVPTFNGYAATDGTTTYTEVTSETTADVDDYDADWTDDTEDEEDDD